MQAPTTEKEQANQTVKLQKLHYLRMMCEIFLFHALIKLLIDDDGGDGQTIRAFILESSQDTLVFENELS